MKRKLTEYKIWIMAAASLVLLVCGLMAQQAASTASVFREQRFGATTATAASAGAVATTTYTWTTPFNDANYTVSCNGVTPTGTPAGVAVNANPTATQVVVVVTAVTAAASSYANVHCIGMHD